jgi:hypothetical protein
LVRTNEFKFEIVATFRVPTLAVVARRFVVERAFGAYRLFRRTNEFKFEIVATFRVPAFAVVARRFVVERAFEA